MEITIGLTAEIKEAVCSENTAEKYGSGSLKVYATPAMVALMEKTACKALEGYLPEGSTTVGTAVNIEHLSATPIGMEVTAKSTVTAVDGRKVSFVVEAFDEVGLIGKGTHDRFIIDTERFMTKVNGKKA